MKRARPSWLPIRGRYISLGAGAQSSALLVMANQGKLGRVDFAIFSDTQVEPAWVYENLERLKRFSKIPIHTVTAGNLADDPIRLPLFTKDDTGKIAMRRRQCTPMYKVVPIEKAVRYILGFKKGERLGGRIIVESLQGISYDEITRMRDSQTSWVRIVYPLVDMKLTREDCKKIVMDAGLPEPKKSACVSCPYHSDDYWQMLKTDHPEEFAKAVAFDKKVRNTSDRPIFIHRSLVPLDQVAFRTAKTDWPDTSGACGADCFT